MGWLFRGMAGLLTVVSTIYLGYCLWFGNVRTPYFIGAATIAGLALLAGLYLLFTESKLDRRLRELGVRRWRVGRFTWPFVGAGWLGGTAARLDDEALLGAWYLPEHTAAAKTAIEAELTKRGIGKDRIAAWLPPAAHTRVRPAVNFAVPFERYGTMVRSRKRLFRSFRWLAGLIAALFVLHVAIGDDRPDPKDEDAQPDKPASASAKGPQPGQPADKRPAPAGATPSVPAKSAAPPSPPKDMRPKETISPDSPLNPARLPPHLKWIGQALEEILGIGYPLAIAGFFLVANITTWRDRTRALRVLLLRPFGEEKMTSAIKQVVLKHLGPQGLVFTLEDRNYKPHWIIAIIGGALGAYYYVIGPLIRPALRIATVKSERRYAKLALSLTDLWMPSFRSFVNGGQAFNIRCTNDWWQTTIDLLMNSSEIIVMDVSRVSKGSAWEIDRLEARGLLPKCIFIVQSGHEGDGMEGVTRLLPAALVPTLFTYEESGEFVDRAAFANAVKAHMQSALATWGRPTQDGIRQDVAVQPSLS